MIKLKGIIASLMAMFMFGSFILAPVTADAQTSTQLKRRQQKKNEWRNLGYAGAALGIYGALKGDSTLTFVGTTGALYSAYRYEQDRKSQGKMERQRAAIFRRGYYYRNGHKYVKKTTWRNGKKYYYFKRA